MNQRTDLLALSPLDGRYFSKTRDLRDYFSESALIKHRILVEVNYLIALTDFLNKEKLTPIEKARLLKWVKNLTLKDFTQVKKIDEEQTNHDVKAVEYFIKANLKKLKLEKLNTWVHWGLTSEDTNNLAYGLMLKGAWEKVLLPVQLDLIKTLLSISNNYKYIAIPARTHGQLAVPTTVGKELIVFASRAGFFLEKLINFKFNGKLNGAVGNFNAFVQIYPHKNWLQFSEKFIKKLGLEPTLITTQIEPSVKLVYFLDLLKQLNNIWLNLSQDSWFYISLNYFKQKIISHEVGSSTMPHKVNPIDFENSEGNLQMANSLLIFLANKLAMSRLQRDLSDSTVKRNLGISFGYSLLGVKSLIKGLGKIEPDKDILKRELANHPEMLSESLQLILKTWGENKAYEQIKQQTRGKKISWEGLISNLKPKQKAILKNWKVEKYVGLASKLVELEEKKIKKILDY